MNKSVQLLLIAVFFIAVSCQKNEIESPEFLNPRSPNDFKIESNSKLKGASIPLLSPEGLARINKRLAATGENYRVAWAECITMSGSNEMGKIIASKDVGNKQLSADFVPDDNRRVWSDDTKKITYAIDQTADAVPSGGLMTAENATEAIENALKTWDDVKNTKIGLTRNDDGGLDIGVVAYQNALGGSNNIFADIQIAGCGDIDFSGGVLGATFTFVFTENGEPTDINKDKKADVAFREIYFDPSWYWADGGMYGIDLQSVALHELGHALSQAHFGTGFVDKYGELRFSPRAVMNPVYSGTFRNLQKSDIGGHSSIWANWPKK